MRSTPLPSFTLPSAKSAVTLGDPTPLAAAAGFSIGGLVDEMKRITNIANAQHSTGPKTPEGKARSAPNALRHGAFAQSTLLPADDPKTFETFRLDFLKTFSPQTTPELFLAERLISLAWRLKRITAAIAEFDCADAFLESIEELDRLSKVEDRLQSMFQRAQKQLELLQKNRRQNPPENCPFLKKEFAQNKATMPVDQTPTPAPSAPPVAPTPPASQPVPAQPRGDEKNAEQSHPDNSTATDAPDCLLGYNPPAEAKCPIGSSKSR
jgi:hypothetical protein